MNVKSFELSSSTGSSQYPLQASRDMKLLATDSLLATSSTLTIRYCGLLRTLFSYLGSITIRTSSFEWSVLFFHFRLSITTIDETQGVLSSSLTIIPSSSISVSFSRAGSRSALRIFLGGCTTGGTNGSTSKCTLLGSLPGLSQNSLALVVLTLE